MNSHIKRAILNGRLVLLLGAGSSRGCKNSLNEEVPLGWGLAKILATEMGASYENEDLADVYAAARKKLGGQVDKIFERYFKYCIPSNSLKSLSKYPFFRIYTLNIDDAFERSVSSDRKIRIIHRNDKVEEVDQFYEELQYIKLNGDINKIGEGFIFSAQEYGYGAAQEPLWYSELSRDYHRFTFLFIGTQLKEPLFYHQIEKYKLRNGGSGLMSYLLIPSLTDIQKQSLESCNIIHLQGTFESFIEWLAVEFEEIPTNIDILKNTRPELIVESKSDVRNINLLDGVTPIDRASLSLIGKPNYPSDIRDFYKGVVSRLKCNSDFESDNFLGEYLLWRQKA